MKISNNRGKLYWVLWEETVCFTVSRARWNGWRRTRCFSPFWWTCAPGNTGPPDLSKLAALQGGVVADLVSICLFPHVVTKFTANLSRMRSDSTTMNGSFFFNLIHIIRLYPSAGLPRVTPTMRTSELITADTLIKIVSTRHDLLQSSLP